MGPNGSGKSTLANVLAGRPSVRVTRGEVLFDGRDLAALSPEERAREGIFLAFQYPVEIPGVANMYFLKAALNAIRKHRGEPELDAMEFLQLARRKMKLVEMDEKLMQRSVNEGFSGGEKKRNEILQMAILEPRLAVLDETDSGLDIDALRVVAGGVNALRGPARAMLVITHYQRLLDYIEPDFVHVLAGGRIATTRRQGAGARARAEGLRLARRGGGAMSALDAAREPLPRAARRRWRRRARASRPGWRSGAPTAREAFREQGLPHTRLEEWRYTQRRAAGEGRPSRCRRRRRTPSSAAISSTTPSRSSPAASTCSSTAASRRRSPPLGASSAAPTCESLAALLREREPERLRAAPGGARSMHKRHPFAALATAFLDDGALRARAARRRRRAADPPGLRLGAGSDRAPTLVHPRVLVRPSPAAGSR